MPATSIKLIVPVAGIIDIPGTLRGLERLQCHERYEVEIRVVSQFPQPDVNPEFALALEKIIQRLTALSK